MTNLTNLGRRLLATILAVLFLGIWLRDLVLLSLAGFGLFYLVLIFNEVERTASAVKAIVITPAELSLTAVAGRETSQIMEISSSRRYNVSFTLPDLRVEPPMIVPGTTPIELVYTPQIGGAKKVRSIYLEAEDSYRLFKSKESIPLRITLMAYPRVFQVAADAIGTLAEMGQRSAGQYPTYLRGSGIEYAETRDYQPGDQLRRFDWKAYARTTRPMVKEYYLEGGSGTSIAYDNYADNPVNLDELNSAFLQLVLSMTQRDTKTQIKLLREGEIYLLDRFNTLLLAIQIALEGQVEDFLRYYELVDPLTHRRGFAEKVFGTKIYSSEIIDEYDSKIVVSALSGNPSELLETLEAMSPEDTSLLVPSKPWIHQGTLERSYYSYRKHVRIIERLENNGYRVYNKPRDLINNINNTHYYQ